jgi:H+/Cl- antiporter ClcA/CBS domain-containing protein
MSKHALPITEDRLADFTTDKRVVVLSMYSIVIGGFVAFIAYGLLWLIAVISNFFYYQRFSSVLIPVSGHHLEYWAVIIPVIGGLIIGVMARFGSEKIRGHGIPEALEAILIGRSRIEAKVAILKPVSSAISIGTGGPFGAEGPVIMTGGAFGSLFAQFFHLSSAERKTLLVAGAAAGMAAVFATPIAAVLLSVELLLFEWKPRSFIPVAMASAVAASLRIPLLGSGPIFGIPAHSALSTNELLVAGALGLTAGLASGMLTSLVYGFEDFFHKLPLHWMWWPVIGGVVVGIGGVIDPRVLGVGYDSIHELLRGNVLGTGLVVLLVVKAVVWSFALGSGTSGGVLAPLLIMGGALGAFEAQWIPLGDTGLWALISMAAMMGGTMRSPFTAIVFTLELTHDLNALPALLISCVAAEIVTVLLLRRSILTEKVARRGHHITREYSVDPLELVRVQDVMDTDPPAIPATMLVTDLAGRISTHDPLVTKHRGYLIIDDHGALVGIITRSDILGALGEKNIATMTVMDVGTKDLIVTYPDEMLNTAAAKMLRNDIGRLPVVNREHPHHILGYLGRPNLIMGRMKRLQEEHDREPGWLAGGMLGNKAKKNVVK